MLKIVLIFLFYFTALNSDEISNLVADIKNADVSQKRVLINKLKLKLRDTNAKDRQKMIKQLKHGYNSKNITKHNTTHKQLHKNQQKNHIAPILHDTSTKKQKHIL